MYLHLFSRTSPKDDEQHQSSTTPSNQDEIRDPFALQTHPQKNWSTPIEQDPSKSFISISPSSISYLDDEHNRSPKLRLNRKYNQVISFLS